jgi:hypothetical protein
MRCPGLKTNSNWRSTFLFIYAEPIRAALPLSRTIAGRLAKNSGKGTYSIEQDVQFRSTAELVTLRERWIVENGENMRLIVTHQGAQQKAQQKAPSDSARFDIVYREGKRTAPDLRGNLRTTALSSEFVEVFSHARSGRGFLEAFVRSGIVPPSFLKERPRFAANSTRYLPEPLVRLGRTGGVVNYVFGEPTPADAKKTNPGVWIEQDAFLLRRLRFPSEAELSSQDFFAPLNNSSPAGGLRLPRERKITWDNSSVVIRLVSVDSIDPASAANLLSPASLTPNDARAARLPDLAQVKEFYSRFR